MFIQTEETPNPNTLKFLPGATVLEEGSFDFPNAEAAKISPLAMKLFEIDGITRVFFAQDFISVTKDEEADWIVLKPSILGLIMEHFTTGLPIMNDMPGASKATASKVAKSSEEDAEIAQQIEEIINIKVRPAIAQDGGDITFERYEDGIVYLHLKGACAGCPSSTLTLKSGIENLLKHHIPEIIEVKQIQDEL